MTDIVERRLELRFATDTSVVKWDEHPAYREHVAQFPCKAVDFCVTHTLGASLLEVIALVLAGEIRRHLKWLNPKVIVTSRSLEEQTRRPLAWVQVTSLPSP